MPINNLDFSSIAKKYKVDIWVHGDDWKKGPQSYERQRLRVNLKKEVVKLLIFHIQKIFHHHYYLNTQIKCQNQ